MSGTENPYQEGSALWGAWARGFVLGRDGVSRGANPYSVRARSFWRAWDLGCSAGLAAFRAAKGAQL